MKKLKRKMISPSLNRQVISVLNGKELNKLNGGSGNAGHTLLVTIEATMIMTDEVTDLNFSTAGCWARTTG